MKAKPQQQEERFDAERFRLELARKLNRLVAEAIDGWSTCENPRCGRARRCASPRRECIAKWQKSRPPLSPQQIEEGLQDLKLSLEVRMRLGEGATAEQLEKAIHDEKAARRAAMPPQDREPLPPVEATQLAPAQRERIDRASNDRVASQPAEQDRPRGRRPRITQL
ncbi:MAG: hypothetical protein QOD09_1728 [Bradyrhizobium sp.]|nr:hypothetical protein [Bradyrhizobium sp.]MEA2952727.1 hypothetical protein [Alphaproteobacteria bacterium]